jgi:hypothetical protein
MYGLFSDAGSLTCHAKIFNSASESTGHARKTEVRMVSERTRTWRAERRFFVGGSDAHIVMGNDEAALLRLWREKRGEAEPQDLSGNGAKSPVVRS